MNGVSNNKQKSPAMIQTGNELPSVPVEPVDANGVSDVGSAEILGQRRVVLFGVSRGVTARGAPAILLALQGEAVACQGVQR